MIEIVLALLVWGAAVEPRLILDIEREVAELPALEGHWDGETIAVVADWQIGMWLGNPAMAERAVARIVEERPAAALFAGDFLTEPQRNTGAKIQRVLALIRPLVEAGVPVVAVLGNHDFGLKDPGEPDAEDAAARLVERLEEAGVTVLQNRATPLFHPRAMGAGLAGLLHSRPLYVAGIGSRYADNDEGLAALEGIPFDAPRIVLMHHPDSFRRLPAWSAPLAVAGHRHGGQLRIPLINMSWLRFRGIPAEGWAPSNFGAPGNTLYITRGTGMSVVPVRINAPPELTFITLRSPRDRASSGGS